MLDDGGLRSGGGALLGLAVCGLGFFRQSQEWASYVLSSLGGDCSRLDWRSLGIGFTVRGSLFWVAGGTGLGPMLGGLFGWFVGGAGGALMLNCLAWDGVRAAGGTKIVSAVLIPAVGRPVSMFVGAVVGSGGGAFVAAWNSWSCWCCAVVIWSGGVCCCGGLLMAAFCVNGGGFVVGLPVA